MSLLNAKRPQEKKRNRNLEELVADMKGENQKLKPLQFKVPEELHKEFKAYAVSHDMKMTDLFCECFETYKTQN